MKSSNEVIVVVHCHNLPGPCFGERSAVRLGIQKGKDVVEDVSVDIPQVTFTIPLRVECNPETGKPNFLGPFAHGTPQERFIYLCWGERKGAIWDGFRRAKLHLKHLTWRQVETALQHNQPLEFSFNMTDAKGGPACGSLNLHTADSR